MSCTRCQGLMVPEPMNAHTCLGQIEEKHGVKLPFMMVCDILDLIHQERMAVVDKFDPRVAQDKQGVAT